MNKKRINIEAKPLCGVGFVVAFLLSAHGHALLDNFYNCTIKVVPIGDSIFNLIAMHRTSESANFSYSATYYAAGSTATP
jgi:hypothetical protein